jgi:aspartyl/asparaginyl-tRNA synthetase
VQSDACTAYPGNRELTGVGAAAAAPGSYPGTDRTYIRDLAKCLGQRVLLYGWFNGLHRPGGQLLVIRDRTGTVPVLYHGDLSRAAGLTRESAVRVVGTVRTGASTRFGAIEVDADEVEVIARADAPPPAETTAATANRHLDLRAPDRLLIFEVQTTVEATLREALLNRGFLGLHTPPGTGRLPYLQLAMAAGFDRAFEVAPHGDGDGDGGLTRLSAELSWVTHLDELTGLVDDLLRRVLFAVRELHGPEVSRHFAAEVELPAAAIPRLAYARAAELTAGARAAGQLSTADEAALSEYARERYGHGYVFVTGFPAAAADPAALRDGDTAATFVLIGHGLRLAEGGLREHRHEPLAAQSEAVRDPDLAWYFDAFRHGCPPHGGFGLDLNRLSMALLHRPSIVDTTFVRPGPGRSGP